MFSRFFYRVIERGVILMHIFCYSCSISDITGVSGIFVGPIFPVGRNGIYSTVICKDRNETVV